MMLFSTFFAHKNIIRGYFTKFLQGVVEMSIIFLHIYALGNASDNIVIEKHWVMRIKNGGGW